MNILLINDSCKEVGGAETYIFAISKFLSKNHDVSLFSYGDKKVGEKNKVVIPYSKNVIKQNFDKFVFNFNVYLGLRNYLRKNRPDVAFIHNNYLYALPVLLALKKEKIKTVQTVHDWGQICPSSWCVIQKNLKRCKGVEGISFKCLTNGCISPLHFFLTYFRNKLRIKFARKTIKSFISPSKMLAKDLVKHNFRNVRCIHHFMEFEKLKLDFSKSKKGAILYVGLLARNKGVNFLICAFKKILGEYPDASLTIVGDGPDRKKLERLSQKLGVDSKINFKGKIPHNEVIEEFKKCKVFCIPSVWMENSPFVIYECMSSGRPVVGSRRGGIPDLILDGKTGLIVEPGSYAQLSETILLILKDDKLFKKFGKNGFKRMTDELTVKNHMNALEEVIQN